MIPAPHRMKGGAAQLSALPGQVGPFGSYGAEARDPGDMEIEVLVVPDCPHRQLAEELGSPTILIDGRDPFVEPGAVPSLAWRIYRAPAGPAGAPSLDQLRQALEAAAGAG
ncbi:hypothetical protein ACH4YO_31780 [Streptomyces noursei]|uniref:hypothetical protein n=1 Tax=Streptomyces noursei TaxID=1971 RepID=UPI0033C39D28